MRMDGCGRREQGSRDWRMLPVALTVWAAALGTRWLFAAVMEPAADGWWTDVGIGWVLAAGACHGVDDDDGVLRRADRVRIHLVRERRRLA